MTKTHRFRQSTISAPLAKTACESPKGPSKVKAKRHFVFMAIALMVMSTACLPTPPGTSGEDWAKLRNCESGGAAGGYKADTGNGFYGAYQFDMRTWRGLGGEGNPADAPSWEQDMRAFKLYMQRGAQPWPVCGRFVR